MTKILKVKQESNKDSPKLSREVIARIGETLYGSEDVKGVRLQVVFKDNSSISFKRSEVADTFEIMEEDE